MWSSNNEGFGDGGNSGAGFMNTSSQFSSPAQGAKKERRTQNIMAVSVKMIEESQGDSVVINGYETHMLVIVGIIRSVEVSSTKITYTIDDSTGIIEGVLWLESESDYDQERQRPLMEMTYCKMVGTLRTQMGKRHIMIFNIVPITDINRITTHILEVIHDPMKLQKLGNMKSDAGSGPSMVTSGNPDQAVASNTHGLSGMSKLIYERIKISELEAGVSRTQLQETFRGKIAPNAIENVLEELSGEGLIFCSIDEEHFKTSDNL